MKLALLNLLLAHVLVNYEGCHVEGFWKESEFAVDVDNPFNEEGSGCVLDLGLYFLEVVGVNHAGGLLADHILVDLLRELRDVLWVSEIEFVRERHIFHRFLFPGLNALLKYFLHRFVGLFVI